MKVFEILRDNIKVVSEEQVIERMKNFDWKYEFSDNVTRLVWGKQELELIENMVYQLWKKEPFRATQIWNEYSGASPADASVEPSFIFRLKVQDK